MWGEQTDVPESADWYNSGYLLVWGSNVPMTRTPDAHFYTEVRYKGTKTVAVSSDFGEMVKFSDIWLAPRQGTDAALALAMGHVVLTEFHRDNPSKYFVDYCKQYTDLPMLVLLKDEGGKLVPDYFLRASHLVDNLGEANNPEWKTILSMPSRAAWWHPTAPSVSAGARTRPTPARWAAGTSRCAMAVPARKSTRC